MKIAYWTLVAAYWLGTSGLLCLAMGRFMRVGLGPRDDDEGF